MPISGYRYSQQTGLAVQCNWHCKEAIAAQASHAHVWLGQPRL